MEADAAIAAKVRDRLSDSPRTLCVSGIVRLECLVGPLRSGDTETLERYRRFLGRLESLSADEKTFDLAAQLRADTGLLLPDALHLAIADANDCDEFWTADAHFSRAAGRVRPQLRILT